MGTDNSISIVVFTNRKDYSLSKICIASVRHFYPSIEIFIVKDLLNGNFSSRYLERAFNVKPLSLGRKYFGWGAAKVHFFYYKQLPPKRFLALDADTIFVGPVLNIFENAGQDFVVNAEPCQVPFSDEVKGLYLDPAKVQKYYPGYEYPGYFFNTGQLLGKPGLLSKELLAPSFDTDHYPFYKNRDAFKLVDQAVLNAVIPLYASREKKSIGQLHYMKWSVSFFNNNSQLSMEDIDKHAFPFIIHYAGDTRSHEIRLMKGFTLLSAFRNEYYSRLGKIEIMFDRLQDKLCASGLLTQILYRKNWVVIKIGKKLGRQI